jgi:hypothetical protein
LRLFKTKWFVRFARRSRIDDAMLCEAISRAERGLIDADLGGGIIKQRVARPNEGRSGGFRTIVGYRSAERAVFLYAFAKNERDNITSAELESLREIGAAVIRADEQALAAALAEGRLQEIDYDEAE